MNLFLSINSLLPQTSGYASDDLDEPEEPAAAPSATKKRKLTKAAEAKLKAAAKKKAKKDGKNDLDGEDGEDAYTALSKSAWTSNDSKPPVGSFETCARCEKRFTVVGYIVSHFSSLEAELLPYRPSIH